MRKNTKGGHSMGMTSKDNNGTKTVLECRVCGSSFSKKNIGRTREYCSDLCRDYFKYFSALDRTISKISFKDVSKIKSIKGDLFSLVNGLPKKIKGGKDEKR